MDEVCHDIISLSRKISLISQLQSVNKVVLFCLVCWLNTQMTKSPHLTLMTSPAVVVKMSVTVIENSPSQAYSHHDDHTVQ